mgnify:FL=1
MKKLLYIMCAVFLLSGCATKSKIDYRDRDVVKYIKSIQHDTLINNVHDSVYNNIFTRGDTVYNFKYKERVSFKDRIVFRTDTLKKDSIQTQYKENTIVKKIIPKWCWILLVVNVFFCIFVGLKYYNKWQSKI